VRRPPRTRVRRERIGRASASPRHHPVPELPRRPDRRDQGEAAENARTRLAGNLKVLDKMIGNNPFVCGAKPTIADCTLLAAFEFAKFAGVEIDPECKNVHRWYESFKARPSAQA
jgi:glutathione S-transferase